MRRLGGIGQTLLALVVTLAVSAGVIAYAQPQVVVGEPLSRRATVRYAAKPDPPKLRAAAAALTKPARVDLGEVPAPITVAPQDDPLALSLALVVSEALIASGNPGASAVSVLDADGRVLVDVGATTPLIPASTAKLVTAAMALATFGPDHVFTTTAAATAAPGQGGVVAGDVVLTGGGDPTLVSRTYVETQIDPERPQTPIADLADQIVAAGVTRVEGAVIGDPGFLAGGPLADGWPPRYLDDLDATAISGLTIDQGFEFVDEGSGLRARAAADPAAVAAAALVAALAERGVEVVGGSRSAPGGVSDAPAHLGELSSPTLMTLLVRMVQESDNHIADTVFRAVGRHAAGAGSFDDAEDVASEVLAALELDWSTTRLRDGSGLSRESAIPPALLTALNYRMTNSTLGEEWQDLMAVSGVSGTLERRLVGTIAELRLRGKTGSLGDVRSISGAVVGPDGRPLYVTVTSNALAEPQLDDARRLQDLVVLGLAAELYGCTEIPPPPPAPDDPLEPDELPPLPTHTCS
ncbi:D-alanyl-D-alanine carboxypeptidase/D-alanyl-D-alanine-endopeptidase [Euzebya sp.]|uniref:D-alanyl-D-alanine carboxypeptidase/D-alanyl-D-alanine endopeptidase n=1 Tax=Euzebya sp. TaxID=1971409 RepID=UPI0035186935